MKSICLIITFIFICALLSGCTSKDRSVQENTIEQVQIEELEKGNKVSINKIVNNWIKYYLGYRVKNYFPEEWSKI